MPPALAIWLRILERLELVASMVSFPEARMTLAGSAGVLSIEKGTGRAGAGFGCAGTDGEGFAAGAAGRDGGAAALDGGGAAGRRYAGLASGSGAGSGAGSGVGAAFGFVAGGCPPSMVMGGMG